MFKVKKSKVKVTRSRNVSADKNAVTRQCMVISTSNLVGIIDVGVNACGIISTSVGRKCIVNTQMLLIRVGDSKDVIVNDPHMFSACAVAAYAFSVVTIGKRYDS